MASNLIMLVYLAGILIGWVLRRCIVREKEQINGYQPKGTIPTEKVRSNPPKNGSAQQRK